MREALHIHNARIWTGDPARPWARSITIAGGRVLCLDRRPQGVDEISAGPAVSINAGGRTIVPGLIDSHLHLLRGGESLSQLDLSRVKSREQFEAAIAHQHARMGDSNWLIGGGWSHENWPGNTLPDKTWLAAARDRPAVCYRMDMHMALVNDAVLRLCDLRSDPGNDLVGGRIERDPKTGGPTGLMIEAAAWRLINPLIPKPDAAMRRRCLLDAQSHAHSLGLTAVGSMEYAADVDEVFAPLREQLSLRCRITLLDRPLADESMDFSVGRDFANDDRLAVIGYKTFIDGTLGSRTARMLEDYADDPGNRGMLVELSAHGRLREWVQAVARSGLSPSMHAIGDEAARMALNAVETLSTQHSALSTLQIRPRIEHAQQIDPSDIPRFAGRLASMQPLHKADDCRYVRKRLGEHRLAGTFAFRKLLDAGAVLAFGSDWPVVSCDPMLGIRAAVTGLTTDGEPFGTDQNLTVEEALRGYTAGAAYALGIDSPGAGVLRPGGGGDLVILDRDPFTANWIDAPPRVVLTIVGGFSVYDAIGCERAIQSSVHAEA